MTKLYCVSFTEEELASLIVAVHTAEVTLEKMEDMAKEKDDLKAIMAFGFEKVCIKELFEKLEKLAKESE